MERLTTRLSDGNYIPKALCTIARDGEVDDVDGCNECCDSCNGECSVCAIQKCFNKLAEYEDLEEQGLLLRLPVPIGTTVYKFEPLAKEAKRYIKTTITRYEVFEDSIWFTFANGLGRNIKDFGKTVFLTQAEAEQKLKEMESD